MIPLFNVQQYYNLMKQNDIIIIRIFQDNILYQSNINNYLLELLQHSHITICTVENSVINSIFNNKFLSKEPTFIILYKGEELKIFYDNVSKEAIESLLSEYL